MRSLICLVALPLAATADGGLRALRGGRTLTCWGLVVKTQSRSL